MSRVQWYSFVKLRTGGGGEELYEVWKQLAWDIDVYLLEGYLGEHVSSLFRVFTEVRIWKSISIIDEVIELFLNLPNPSSHTMALELTQPLTEMSTRNLQAGKGPPADAYGW
jgi:hypothetical protein